MPTWVDGLFVLSMVIVGVWREYVFARNDIVARNEGLSVHPESTLAIAAQLLGMPMAPLVVADDEAMPPITNAPEPKR